MKQNISAVVWSVIVLLIMPFLALAQLEGSYDKSGFACRSGDDFSIASVPEQSHLEGVWELNSNDSMRAVFTVEGCTINIEGSYTANDSEITYTVSSVNTASGSCPADTSQSFQKMEGRSQTHRYVLNENFLYILEPRNLAGRSNACGDNDIYSVFIRQ